MDRSKSMVVMGVGLALMLVAFTLMAVRHQFAPADAPANEAAAKLSTFAFGPAELADRFNKIAATGQLEYRITSQQMKPAAGDFDNWTYMFTDRVGFSAIVKRDTGRIAMLTYMGSGDGTIRSGANLLFVLGTLVKGVDPALEKETAGRLALDLLGAVQSKADVRRVMNGVEYQAFAVKDVGVIAQIRPSE
jgi:hypothetical protein